MGRGSPVAPVVVWLLLAVLVGLAVRHVAKTLPRWERTGEGERRWLRWVILPTVGWLTVGLGLWLALPLGAARHFYLRCRLGRDGQSSRWHCPGRWPAPP